MREPAVVEFLATNPRGLVVDAVRAVLDARRRSADACAQWDLVGDLGDLLRPSLRRVVNGTGVLLHTNLGRASLSERAIRAAVAAAGSCSLEWDDQDGRRGSRHEHVRAHLREITGAEDSCVVNTNAGALLLAIAAVGPGEVVVSRGQLVEIGGGFRIPEIISAGGARLVEVGTTNRTHLKDYAAAITEQTVAIIRVHPSNFRAVGFVHDVPLRELAELSRSSGITLIDDIGSGVLREHPLLDGEPAARTSVATGADIVCFSADKLLGGPQAGVAVGSEPLIAACRRHPLMRALRPDKLTLAALEATLAAHRDPVNAWREIPVLRQLAVAPDLRRTRAARIAAKVSGEVVSTVGRVGGGTMPLAELQSHGVAIGSPRMADELARRLRSGQTPIATRICDRRVTVDVLALTEADLDEIPELITAALDV